MKKVLSLIFSVSILFTMDFYIQTFTKAGKFINIELIPTDSNNADPNTKKGKRESIINTAPMASYTIELLADNLIAKKKLNEYMQDVLRSVFRGIYWLGINHNKVNINILSAHILDLPTDFFKEPFDDGMTLLDKALVAWNGSDKFSIGGYKARRCAMYIIKKGVRPSKNFFIQEGNNVVENYIMFGKSVDEWELINKLAEMGLNLSTPLVRKHISNNNSILLNDYYISRYSKCLNLANNLNIPVGVMSKEPFLNIVKYCQKNGWKQ